MLRYRIFPGAATLLRGGRRVWEWILTRPARRSLGALSLGRLCFLSFDFDSRRRIDKHAVDQRDRFGALDAKGLIGVADLFRGSVGYDPARIYGALLVSHQRQPRSHQHIRVPELHLDHLDGTCCYVGKDQMAPERLFGVGPERKKLGVVLGKVEDLLGGLPLVIYNSLS